LIDKDKIATLDKKIVRLRKIAEDILENGRDIEAVSRNTKRILASIRMLEINISDALLCMEKR